MTDREHLALLESFMNAFNAHDADALMRCMTEDCIFHTAAGPEPQGVTLAGQAEVKAGFEAIWRRCPDARWSAGKHFVSGNRGLSEWLFTGTPTDGSEKSAVRGVDVFEFRDGKIHAKDTYRKQKTA